MRALLVIWTACCAGLGCEGPPEYDADACTHFIVPQHMGLRWEHRNHRVARWQMLLHPAPGDTCKAENLQVGMAGADDFPGSPFADSGRVTFVGQTVAAIGPDPLGAARIRLELDLGQEAELLGEVDLRRTALNLVGYPSVVALVEGLSLSTDGQQATDPQDDSSQTDAAVGYPSQGMGASVRVAALDTATVSLAYSVRFARGTSDLAATNGGLAAARAGVILDVLLIGSRGLKERRGVVDYELAYDLPTPLRDEPLPHAPGSAKRVILPGDPKKPVGVFGLARFDLRLQAADPGAGYYLREVSIGATLERYDAYRGVAHFLIDGFASNASELVAYYPLASHVTAELVWLQGAGFAEEVSVQAPVPAGLSVLRLPP